MSLTGLMLLNNWILLQQWTKNYLVSCLAHIIIDKTLWKTFNYTPLYMKYYIYTYKLQQRYSPLYFCWQSVLQI